jgi:glycosyltransferase involved in cell wall biosynthesis
MQAKKILLITNIPNAYRIPLFNELNQKLKVKGAQLTVVFGSRGFSRIKSVVNIADCAFDYKILPSRNFHLGNSEKIFTTYQNLYKTIKQIKPDVIITIGYSIATTKLWLRSFFKKTVYIIWSGSIIKKDRNNSILRKMQRILLAKRATGFIAYGTKAKETFIEMGIRSEKISIAINTVDTSFFVNETEKMRTSTAPDKKLKHITSVGYLTKRKNVQKVLEVIKELSKKRNDFILDIIGEGKERKNLHDYVMQNGIEKYVRFHGFKQKQELPGYFAISDCFLFQTGFDIWGLVLNEAMAAGIPCLASVNAGATYDLVKEGETGFVADFCDIKNTCEKINWLLDNPEKAIAMGQNAKKYICDNASLSKSVEGIINAIEKI